MQFNDRDTQIILEHTLDEATSFLKYGLHFSNFNVLLPCTHLPGTRQNMFICIYVGLITHVFGVRRILLSLWLYKAPIWLFLYSCIIKWCMWMYVEPCCRGMYRQIYSTQFIVFDPVHILLLNQASEWGNVKPSGGISSENYLIHSSSSCRCSVLLTLV